MNSVNVRIFFSMMVALIIVSFHLAEAGQAKVYRVGVILQGGPTYQVVDGLREGLKELGLEEGKHFLLEIRDTKGDLKAVEQVARNLERDKVDLLYTVNTSVTIAVRRLTADIPIVFFAGADPVALGLVDSFANPGGRVTGVYFRATDLTAKRLEILKEILPKLRRVVTFYDPGNPVAREASRLGREAAQQLPVSSTSGTSHRSRTFRRVCERLGPGKWMPTSKCRTRWWFPRLN